MRRALVALGLACVVAVGGCSLQPNDYTLPGQAGVGSDGYTVTVHFAQVENLVPNSTVQLDNVTIGTVASVKARDWQADVTLRLRTNVPIPDNAVFSIGQKTLLGAQYVDVSIPRNSGVGATAYLSDGDVIGKDRTGSYPSTEEVLGSAALLLNNGGLSQISVLTGQLSTALRHRVPDARDLIAKTNRLLGVLNDNRSNIIGALTSLERISSRLDDHKDVVAKAIDHITPGLKALNAERANLVRAVTRTGAVSTRAAEVVQVNQQALLANLDALRPILDNLSTAANRLPEALKIAVTIPFPAMTSTRAIKGDYANLFANLDLRIPGLAQSFLGIGTGTALGVANPFLGPVLMPSVTGPEKSTGSGAKHGAHQGSTPAPQPVMPAPPAASPSPTTSSRGVCLLGLIGDC